jgi:SEC-C motif-containing protein
MPAFAKVQSADPCPCGSGARFDACCAPILSGTPAATALALMRSRYTAFVVGDAAHLTATWHPGTAPATLHLDPAVRWTGLEILDVVDGGEAHKRGIVEFRAGWREPGGAGDLHERSRFVKQSERWWYLDGVISD